MRYRVIHLGDALPTGSRVVEADGPLEAVMQLVGTIPVRESYSHLFEGLPALTLISPVGWFTIKEEES